MISFRRFAMLSVVAAVVAAFAPLAHSQVPGIETKLGTQYTVTKATADRSDIVTAGSVLVLQKDNLLMYTTTTTMPPTNTYKDGKISQGVFGFAACKWCKKIPGNSSPNVDNRTFVSGEKFWVTKIYQHDDGLYFELFSDPISDVRYYALLKFPYSKSGPPSADQLQASVAEVLKVQPDDSGGDTKDAAAPAGKAAPAGAAPAQAAAAPAPAPAQAMAPIAPPPPPADTPPPQPKTIALHQTKDQVVAILGQPTKVVKLGAKEIDYYADMKVTFVGGKVSDVQ